MPALIEPNQVGKRETLADTITTADEKDRPFSAMVPKEKARVKNMRLDWQADKFDAPNTSGVADGVDVENFENAAKDRRLLSVYAQKFRRTAMVGDEAEHVSTVAGAPSELARALSKKLEEIGRDIEGALCGDNVTVAEVDKNTPYKLRGLGDWLNSSAQTTLPVPAAYLTPAASLEDEASATFTEDGHFRPVLKSVYTEHGKMESMTLICGTTMKETITNFTRAQLATPDANTFRSIRAFNQNISEKKVTSCITVYEGDFNTVHVIPSLLLDTDGDDGVYRGYLLPMSMCRLCYYRLPRVRRLEDRGGGPRAYVDAILALKYLNPLRGGKFHGTS